MNWLRDHRTAVLVALGSVGLYVVCGVLFAYAQRIPVWHGLYCATANAMTEGDCDVAPTTPLGYVINTVEHLALVAIGAAVLALFTSRLSAAIVKRHVDNAAEAITQHTERRLRHHLGEPRAEGETPDGEPQ